MGSPGSSRLLGGRAWESPQARSVGWGRPRLWEAEQTNTTHRNRPQGDEGRPWRRGRPGFPARKSGAKTFVLKS